MVVVSFTPDKDACSEWFDLVIDHRFKDQVSFYIDAERKLYKQFGFDWNHSLKNWKPFIMREYSCAHNSKSGEKYNTIFTDPEKIGFTFQDFKFRRFVENDNSAQQGGDAVLDGEGKLLKIFPMSSVNDRPTVKDVLEI